jgi:hypothetical protein
VSDSEKTSRFTTVYVGSKTFDKLSKSYENSPGVISGTIDGYGWLQVDDLIIQEDPDPISEESSSFGVPTE